MSGRCPKHVLNMSKKIPQTCPKHVPKWSQTCPENVQHPSKTCANAIKKDAKYIPNLPTFVWKWIHLPPERGSPCTHWESNQGSWLPSRRLNHWAIQAALFGMYRIYRKLHRILKNSWNFVEFHGTPWISWTSMESIEFHRSSSNPLTILLFFPKQNLHWILLI